MLTLVSYTEKSASQNRYLDFKEKLFFRNNFQSKLKNRIKKNSHKTKLSYIHQRVYYVLHPISVT
jgi:hypothetical protein